MIPPHCKYRNVLLGKLNVSIVSWASCTYYCNNPRLIKDFVSQYGKTKYYWSFSMEGQMERKRINGDRSNGLSGHSGPASDVIDTYNKIFYKHTDSENFPYKFNPNVVCEGCKFYLK
jgi:hypothetical protein